MINVPVGARKSDGTFAAALRFIHEKALKDVWHRDDAGVLTHITGQQIDVATFHQSMPEVHFKRALTHFFFVLGEEPICSSIAGCDRELLRLRGIVGAPLTEPAPPSQQLYVYQYVGDTQPPYLHENRMTKIQLLKRSSPPENEWFFWVKIIYTRFE
jgi:hypothetical protein